MIEARNETSERKNKRSGRVR